MNTNLTEVIAVLDGSLSMGHLIESVTEGVNSFAEAQKTEPGECFITVYTFDGDPKLRNRNVWNLPEVPNPSRLRLRLIRDRVNVRDFKHVGPLEYRAEGNTPLNDAVMQVMDENGKRFAAMPESERPGNVIMFISTDGAENDSTEYPRRGNPAVSEAIRLQENEYNWHFIFTGSDISTYDQGAELGVNISNVLNYSATPIGTEALYRGVSNKIGQLRRGEVRCCSFNAAEKSAIEGIEDDAADPLASSSGSSGTSPVSTT